MKRSETIILGIVLLSFAVGILSYPYLPEKVPLHWSFKGEVDSTISRSMGAFLVPFAALILYGVFMLVPRVDPMKENIAKFRKYYDEFLGLLFAFFLYVYLLNISWSLGYRFNFLQFLAPAFGAVFYILSTFIGNARRNTSMGIRTPWTLQSDEVWRKTHEACGKVFKIMGVAAALGFFFPSYALGFILIPIFGMAVFTMVYSYREFQKEKGAKK